ncbi:hypothetical protein E8E13_005601 [Curvularia kusanoi]|uniref:F-box domain-containing protein n=1 Tax=Curvularia kusanoi TaxID=90978 RepID=A0A9P4TEH4_CURKU|nr:hypothetical protein E8E13_005601 [Curvularia kusanoi]
MSGQDACFITALPIDIIYNILDFVPFESHFDFARTCKKIAESSSGILKRHQEAYSKYRVASDISPTTVPTLLRSIFGRADPILAWHVRLIEVWHDRKSWSEWKNLRFDQCPSCDQGVCSPWKWQDDELDEYLEDIEDQFAVKIESGDSDLYGEAHEQFANGFDGILKMLLILHCPRLSIVKFVTEECHTESTLGWLSRMIQACILYGSNWPPGMSSIQEIAVGVESGTWMSRPAYAGNSRHNRHVDPENRAMWTFATLLRLPRLESLYYNHLQRPTWNHDPTDYGSHTLMAKRSSSVKHIFLDDCGHMPEGFMDALSEAPLALETFTLRAGNNPGGPLEDSDRLVYSLCDSQSGSLHTLMLYGYHEYHQHGGIRGYRCSCYRNEELRKARRLKTVAMDIYDVDLDCMGASDGQDGKWTEEESRNFFIKWFCETAFPSSIERMSFWGEPYHHMQKGKGIFFDWLEDALITVIQSHSRTAKGPGGEEGHADFYRNLKAVHLEEIERQYSASRPGYTGDWQHDEHIREVPNTHRRHFQKLIEVGKEAGVDIHTLTNRAPPKNPHSLPTAPDKYDLVSGPWWAQRDDIKDWVFDVYKGRRVPPGCGKCGECKECLSVYTKELWSTVQ